MIKLLLFVSILFFNLTVLSQIKKTYNGGAPNWLVPTNIDTLTVECFGGGGGAGNSANTQTNGGHGGGGGAYSRSIFTNWGGDTCFINVGTAGSRGGTYPSGVSFQPTSGGTTFVSKYNSIPLIITDGVKAPGGGSGLNNYIPQLNNGGSANQCIGQFTHAGGNGKSANSNGGGGGGASGNYLSAGASAAGQSGALGQNGGGNGGNGASVGGTGGTAGAAPGGGGGGSDDWWNSGAGDGANGRVIITLNGMYITGNIFNDANNNCLKDAGEIGLSNIYVYLNELDYIANTDNSGNYYLPKLPIGNYTLSVNAPGGWQNSCSDMISFNIVNPDSIINLQNAGIYSLNPCSSPEVSVYAPFLRRCFSNQLIYVSACNTNSATGTLNSSYVEVELDSKLIVTNASIPFTSLGSNIFRFDTGNINSGQCVNFNISTTISCNALNGQTLCLDATLYPIESCALDTIPTDPPTGGGGTGGTSGTLNGLPQPCLLPWDQSSLSVDGWCANDSIYFTITNTGELGGGDMECYSPMWITVDGVVTYTDSIIIQGGQTLTLSFPGDGQTWILNAEQHPLHPGNSHPNAHVEACGDTTNWTPDIVNDFPQDDADPVVDIYCGVVTGSFDPNDKTGYPIGQTEQFYIQPNQQMQYVIRFQNTGTDTAFTVVIRDTLETDLNIFTVTPGVSSHNYEFRMYGPRVLEWTFNNILLPDSTTNSEGSNGFVTFHVDQVNDLAPGREITNDADIYFDFNEPITTNTTIHRIYEGFVAVATLEEMIKETSGLTVYPNPSNGAFTLVMDKGKGEGSYSLYDQHGRIVKTGMITGEKTTIDLDLNAGMYYLMVGSRVAKVQVVK